MTHRHSISFASKLLFAASIMTASSVYASATNYISGAAAPTSNAPITATTYKGSNSRGFAFTVGPTGSFNIGTIDFIGISNAVGSNNYTFKLDLRNTTSTTAGSALAGSTLFASDTISVNTTGSAYKPFNLTSTNIPNIFAYNLINGNSYSLIFYGVSSSTFNLGRVSGNNNNYTTTNGFTTLNSITNNNANYIGPVQSYVVNIGPSAVPVPGAVWLFLSGLMGVVSFNRRKNKATNIITA
ncbi:MAG: hypothetical protein QX196_12130 [Methylococcaceae bacterium]